MLANVSLRGPKSGKNKEILFLFWNYASIFFLRFGIMLEILEYSFFLAKTAHSTNRKGGGLRTTCDQANSLPGSMAEELSGLTAA